MARHAGRRAFGLLHGDAAARAAPQMARAGNPGEVLLLDIVEHVHHGIAMRQIHDRVVGQHAIHRQPEDLPLLRPPEIVHHQVAAAQQIFAQALRPRRRSSPNIRPAWRRSRDSRRASDRSARVARVAGIHARQAPDAHGEVLVGIGPIHHPPAVAGGAARGEAEAPADTAAGRCIPCG